MVLVHRTEQLNGGRFLTPFAKKHATRTQVKALKEIRKGRAKLQSALKQTPKEVKDLLKTATPYIAKQGAQQANNQIDKLAKQGKVPDFVADDFKKNSEQILSGIVTKAIRGKGARNLGSGVNGLGVKGLGVKGLGINGLGINGLGANSQSELFTQ